MSRKTLGLVAALAIVAAAMGPIGAAGAQQQEPDPGDGGGIVPASDTGSYVVVMADDPLIVTEGTERLDTPAAEERAQDLVEAQDRALEETGIGGQEKVNEYTVALNGFSALISQEEAQRLAARKDVALVLPDPLRQPQTDASPEFLGLTGPGRAWDSGVTGEGVVVGVIDTGIWPEHPSFADDGSYPEPPTAPLPCEFGNVAHNRLDAPFPCNNKLVGARQTLATYRALNGAEDFEYDSARDDNGHGTHTASTAAGNAGVEARAYGRPLGTVSGIAPRAHVVAYKGLGDLGGYGSDLAAAIDQAVADGVDVINYSIGGGASLTGPDDIAFLNAADAGVFVATSAGNSGPGEATIGGPGSVPWVTTVGASTQRRSFQGRVVLGDGREFTGVSITPGAGPAPLVDAEAAGDILCTPGSLDPAVVAGKIVVCQRGAIARVDKSRAVREAGGVGMIMYEQSDAGDLHSDLHWVPSVHLDNAPGLAIKAYAATEGATATLVTGERGENPDAPSMTAFSSRGPNPVAEDIIKPDITAPGIQILAGHSPTPSPGSYPSELFQAIAGTSMSSPHVAGVYALLKQVHPDWTPAMAKSAIMTSADPDVRDNDRVTPANPFGMGAGHLDPGRTDRRGTAFQPGLVFDAGVADYLGFLCEAGPEVIANPDTTCAALADAGVATTATDLNLPSIGVAQLAGEETVTRTVTSVADRRVRFRAHVEAPEGYEVEVSPAAFTIEPGQEVTYRVTIRNRTGPVGEWAFGSLTWRGGRYAVRSPLAVRGALFDAPAEVTGEGEAGSAAFDVQFGYTGAYSAAAHGLETATVINDTVVQDPNQTFDPGDTFSDSHTFELSGAAHFRVAIPPEATEQDADLDVYVTNPAGELVASSTLGGTDEQIDIPLPEDGTWTVWVHGWAAPGGDSPYTLYGWDISATPGGNLSVDEAPDEAVIGETERIEVSWDGAAAGEWHLGAVSHTGPDGLIGLTLVEVDNR